MKRQTPVERDLFMLDEYERAMRHHQDLLAEAERGRLLKQIPHTGQSKAGLFKTLLTEIGSMLIALGERMKEVGNAKTAQEEFSFRSQENR